jgi:hypothetical protein
MASFGVGRRGQFLRRNSWPQAIDEREKVKMDGHRNECKGSDLLV